MSTHFPDSADHSVRGTTGRREKIGRKVTCKICQAVYVPARTHMQLVRSPQAVVESAFMGMCHFCFRCRRPACPSCWDEVHGVCGACALEAQLPFRSSVPPLEGVIVPPIEQLPLARVRTVTPPLVCVQPGRFQQSPLPIESQTTLYVQTFSDQPRPDRDIERSSPQTPIPAAKPQERTTDDIADMATRPDKRRVHSKDTSHKAATRRVKPERTATKILFLIVVLIAIFIASALLSLTVNDAIVYLFHVDIRSGIAYLLQLLQHLFSTVGVDQWGAIYLLMVIML
jgi:hypothetical protein